MLRAQLKGHNVKHHNGSVSLASIVIDHRFQTRAAMDAGAISEYADAIRQSEGWPFPPIKVVSQFVVDGFHRVEAVKRVIANSETTAKLRKLLQDIPVERVAVDLIFDNVPDLALQHALAANQTHGLRRSIADKRHAVELALKSWPDKSDREIATMTGTTHPFVGKVRRLELETLPPESGAASRSEDLRDVETLPLGFESESAQETPRQVETLPLAKQQASSGDGEKLKGEIQRKNLNPEERARNLRSIAHQHRDKLVRAIDDYNTIKEDALERERLVRLVQSVVLW
jgi:hypothetical protein